MNNVARGVVFGLALVGTGIMFFATLASATPTTFRPEDLAETLLGGFSMLSCAVIAAGALSGMTSSPQRQAVPPYAQQGAVPQQPYPQPQHRQQPYAPPQRYGQQPPR